MVTAFEDLVAQTATQVCLSLEERAGKLKKRRKIKQRTTKTRQGFLFNVELRSAGPFARRA